MTITTGCLLSINNFTGAHSRLEWYISYSFFRSLESLIMIGLYLLAISLAINLSKSKHYLVETEDGSVKLQSEGNFTFSLSKEKGAFRITLTWIQSWYLISENIEMDEIDAKNVSMKTLTNQKVSFSKIDCPTPTHNLFSQSKLLSTSVVSAVQVLRKFFIEYLETFILI